MTDTTYVDEIQPLSGSTFSFNGLTVNDTPPSTNQVLVAVDPSNVEWQTGTSSLQTTGSNVNFNTTPTPSTGDILYASSATTGDWTVLVENSKANVKVATTEAITITSINTGDVIDGITLENNDRVLVKDNTTENGIYTVNNTGGLTRSSDFELGLSVSYNFIFVSEGNTNKDCGYICTNVSGSDTVGSNLTFKIFSNPQTNLTVASASALELAVNSSSSNNITVLPGNYTLSSTLNLSSNISISGSKHSTVINGIFNLDGVDNISIQDIEFGLTTSDNSIIFESNPENVLIKDCVFNSTDGISVLINSGSNVNIVNCIFNNTHSRISIDQTNASFNIDNINIIDCKFDGLNAGNFSISIDVSANINIENIIKIDGCRFTNMTGGAITTFTGYIYITNSTFTNVTNAGGAIVSATTNLILQNCQFRSSTSCDFGDAFSNINGNVFMNPSGFILNANSTKSIISSNYFDTTTSAILITNSNANALIKNNISFAPFEIPAFNTRTKVLANNNQIITSQGSPNGYEDYILLDTNLTIGLPDLNFTSATHTVNIFATGSGSKNIQPNSPGTLNDGITSYTNISLNPTTGVVVLQWSGLVWNVLTNENAVFT